MKGQPKSVQGRLVISPSPKTKPAAHWADAPETASEPLAPPPTPKRGRGRPRKEPPTPPPTPERPQAAAPPKGDVFDLEIDGSEIIVTTPAGHKWRLQPDTPKEVLCLVFAYDEFSSRHRDMLLEVYDVAKQDYVTLARKEDEWLVTHTAFAMCRALTYYEQ